MSVIICNLPEKSHVHIIEFLSPVADSPIRLPGDQYVVVRTDIDSIPTSGIFSGRIEHGTFYVGTDGVDEDLMFVPGRAPGKYNMIAVITHLRLPLSKDGAIVLE